MKKRIFIVTMLIITLGVIFLFSINSTNASARNRDYSNSVAYPISTEIPTPTPTEILIVVVAPTPTSTRLIIIPTQRTIAVQDIPVDSVDIVSPTLTSTPRNFLHEDLKQIIFFFRTFGRIFNK